MHSIADTTKTVTEKQGETMDYLVYFLNKLLAPWFLAYSFRE